MRRFRGELSERVSHPPPHKSINPTCNRQSKLTQNKTKHKSIRFRDLPINSLLFLSENAVVGAGHDMNPLLFSGGSGGWAFEKKLEEKKEEKKVVATTSGVAAARAMFQNRTNLGQSNATIGSDKLSTTHESAITCMRATSVGSGNVKTFTTTGMDGKLVNWDVATLDLNLGALNLQ